MVWHLLWRAVLFLDSSHSFLLFPCAGWGLGEFSRGYLLAQGGGWNRVKAGYLLLDKCLQLPQSWCLSHGMKDQHELLLKEALGCWSRKKAGTWRKYQPPKGAWLRQRPLAAWPFLFRSQSKSSSRFPEKLLLSEKLGNVYDFCHQPKILLLLRCRSFHSCPMNFSGFPGDISRFLAPLLNRAEKDTKEWLYNCHQLQHRKVNMPDPEANGHLQGLEGNVLLFSNRLQLFLTFSNRCKSVPISGTKICPIILKSKAICLVGVCLWHNSYSSLKEPSMFGRHLPTALKNSIRVISHVTSGNSGLVIPWVWVLGALCKCWKCSWQLILVARSFLPVLSHPAVVSMALSVTWVSLRTDQSWTV